MTIPPAGMPALPGENGWRRGDFPVAEKISERILPLPMYPELTGEHLAQVVATIRAFFG